MPRETLELEPSPTPFVHVVTKGETLLAIAIKYGVELDQLLAANPDIDPHFLSVGQSLSIPGPNGEPVQSLLPTSTPLPLMVSNTRCFQTPSNQITCVAMVDNPGGSAIEALAGQISVLNASGDVLQSKLAYAPLNLLPPGGKMPLYADFGQPETPIAGAQTQIRSAVEAQTSSDRYLSTDYGRPDIVFSADRRQVTVDGTLNVAATADQGDWREALLAIAYDASDQLVGFAKWDSGQDPVHIEHQEFALNVFSLGPPIDHIAIMAEARLVTLATRAPGP
jgi:hypothetical protein